MPWHGRERTPLPSNGNPATSSITGATAAHGYEGTHGERIAVRVSSLDTNGAYAVVESIAAPGCATPMHLHRNEAEHFVIIAGSYRIAIGEKMYEAASLIAGAISPASPDAW